MRVAADGERLESAFRLSLERRPNPCSRDGVRDRLAVSPDCRKRVWRHLANDP